MTIAGDWKILRSDDRSFVVEFTPRFSPATRIPLNDGLLSVYDFAGSISEFSPDETGFPDLRFYALPLAFPSPAGHAVQLVAADYEEIMGESIAPIPGYRERDGMMEVAGYQRHPGEYSRSEFLPVAVGSIGQINEVRGTYVGNLKVYPVQFNPSNRTIRKYSRLVIEVVFGSPLSGAGFDGSFPGGDVLNAHVAHLWGKSGFAVKSSGVVSSVLSSGEWYRLTVMDEGIYRLDAQFFSSIGVDPGSIDPRTIKIYGNGGREIPEQITAPRAIDLIENAIFVSGESDGQFNGGDFVLFYARGTRGWTYAPNLRRWSHYINRYSESNYYWLTFNGAPGKRMQTRPSVNDNPAVVPERFTDFVLIEEEKVNLLSSGKDWYGQSLNAGGSFTHVSSLTGLLANDVIRYRYRFIARANTWSTFSVRDNGLLLGSHNIAPVTDEFQFANEGTFEVVASSSMPVQSQFNVSYSTVGGTGTGWIDWLEIHYPRRFEAVNNYLRFRSPDTSGIVEYRLAGFPSLPFLFDVSTPDSVLFINGAVGSYTIRMNEAAGKISEYVAAGTASFRTPSAVVRAGNQNLRGNADGADFIILTSREFRSAAERLAAHRSQPAYGGLVTLVVDVDSVYNEFAGGIPDITAIRDYLKYAFDNWTRRPEFVLFLGGGSYDYKGISGSRSSFVPTWQSAESRYDLSSYSTDDYFAKFGSGDAPSLVLGRISSRSAAEANIVVGKIIQYDANPARDGWGARMLFIGDDSWTPEREDGTIHSEQAEALATIYTPDEFDKRKIYLAEFPTVNTAQGRRKPGAYQAIIDEINSGALVVNFVGHGNPTVWAHESVFSVQTSIPQLVNPNKLMLLFAATCNFSQFDDLKRYTGSELMMNKPDGGSIAVVSATRKVFSGANAALHRNVFARMFSRDQFGRLRIDYPARALFRYKALFNTVNDQKFFFMGDPTMLLKFPVGYAAIDSVNEEPVDSLHGQPRTSPIQLRALSKVSLKGTIRNSLHQVDVDFNGRVGVTLNDATRPVTITAFVPERVINGQTFPPIDWTYTASGGTIYRGENSVANGRFQANFIVPKDILYADSTSRGRVIAYFSNGSGDGIGFTSRVWVGGTDSTAENDIAGPSINIFLDSRGFRSGDLVSEQPTLFVDLADSNGINTSGSGIGHRIEAWINRSAESRDLTPFYASRLDRYQEGTVEYQLKGLPAGSNSVRVRAWDTHNNASEGEVTFEITSTDQLRISDVMNYPNPFSDATAFTFKQNQLTPLNIGVKIYTLAGRLIQSIERFSSGEPFVKIFWDGRDKDGDILANGVYLYKLVVKTTDGRFSSEALGRLAVLK